LIKKTVWVPNSSATIQTELAAETPLAEEQFLLQEQILNEATISLIDRVGTRRPTVTRRAGQSLDLR
jgi:hypothetical protein